MRDAATTVHRLDARDGDVNLYTWTMLPIIMIKPVDTDAEVIPIDSSSAEQID